jgi:CHAD domain-containing protein
LDVVLPGARNTNQILKAAAELEAATDEKIHDLRPIIEKLRENRTYEPIPHTKIENNLENDVEYEEETPESKNC